MPSGVKTRVAIAWSYACAERERGKCDVPPDESCRAGERIRILEHLAELRRRLHRRQCLQRALGRHVLELEQPFEILPRQARARADQVLDQHPTRRVGVAKLEGWQKGRDRRVPRELALVHELGQHQCRQGLRVRRDHEEGVGIRCRGAAQLAHAESPREDDLAVLYQSHRNAWHACLSKTAFDERRQRGNLRRPKLLRRLAGELSRE